MLSKEPLSTIICKHLIWFDQGLNLVLLDHWWTLYPLYKWDSIYIYIYIYLIEHNRHFLSTYFLVNSFELPYWSSAQLWAERTWEITNYGRFINQFLLNIIRSIWQFERINKKYLDKKSLLCSMKYVSMKKCCLYIYIYIVL